MSTSIKTFFAANKTAIMIGCAAIVVAAQSLNFYSRTNAENNNSNAQQQMQQPVNNQMQQQAYGNMGGNGYQQQMPQQQQQMNTNQESGFWGDMFGGDESYDGANAYSGGSYNNGYTNNGYSGYTNAGGSYGSYSNGYTGYTNTGSGYNANSGADYTSGWYANQATNDRIYEKFTDYITDQARYTDENGNDYKMSSGYDNNWVNTTTNQSVQTNDYNYDPNVGSSYSYSNLTPSDYSSSSYTSTTPE